MRQRAGLFFTAPTLRRACGCDIGETWSVGVLCGRRGKGEIVMATNTIFPQDKKCGACRWWEGKRVPEIHMFKGVVRIRCDSAPAYCPIRKMKMLSGGSCPRFSKWEKL